MMHSLRRKVWVRKLSYLQPEGPFNGPEIPAKALVVKEDGTGDTQQRELRGLVKGSNQTLAIVVDK